MKLYNTIAVFDVYVVAETPEEAQATLMEWVGAHDVPHQVVAVEASREAAVREAWHELRPFVGNDVSDADFKAIKGKTTGEIFRKLYQKQP